MALSACISLEHCLDAITIMDDDQRALFGYPAGHSTNERRRKRKRYTAILDKELDNVSEKETATIRFLVKMSANEQKSSSTRSLSNMTTSQTTFEPNTASRVSSRELEDPQLEQRVCNVDHTYIRQLLAASSERKRICGEEILRLQQVISTIEAEEEQHRALYSPIQNLPADVLSYIFAYAYDTNHFGPTSYFSVSLLSLVCKSWRKAALSEPSIWARLAVTFDFNQGFTPAVYEGIRLYLARARAQLAVDIIIESTSATSYEKCEPFLNLLLAKSNRWHHLRILGSHMWAPSFSFVSHQLELKARLSALQTLELEFPRYPESQYASAALDLARFTRACPSVRSLGLYNMQHALPLAHLLTTTQPLALAAITHLSLHHTTEAALAILSLCRSIQSAHIRLIPPSTLDNATFRHSFKLFWLRNLVITQSHITPDDLMMASFFDGFSAPFLASLSILSERTRQSRTTNGRLLDSLLTFIRNTGGHLTELGLEGVPLIDRSLLWLIQCASMNKLEALAIREGRPMCYPRSNLLVTTEFLEALTIGDRPILIPQLRRLRLHGYCDKGWAKSVLEGLLQSRMPRLISVDLTVGEGSVGSLDMARLQKLQRDGLALRVRASGERERILID
ncbi:hypothetical protein VNI00_003816 [Paramarasmius palmivorus]|uniref:F-box domain-containing protein n=1 Tax=Paramarasmius palmivorus TaxID=297713 RepID=A0AAW0DQF1_9AGAR